MVNKPFDKINGDFRKKDIVSIDQFIPKDVNLLFSQTQKMKKIAKNSKQSSLLANKIVTLLFFEPSTRTFSSFSAAVKKLGGQTIEIQNPMQTSSIAKGETFDDTIKTFEAYSDTIVIRHPDIGSAQAAAQVAKSIPVINAGDGGGEHPTQALTDLYTIYEKFKRLNNLTVLVSGDMLHSRTIHSLLKALSLYSNNTVYLLCPKELRLSQNDSSILSKKQLRTIEIDSIKQMPKNAHVWYWNRIQKERFRNLKDAQKHKRRFVLTSNLLRSYGNNQMIIMDPLPKVEEIDVEIDNDTRAVYFSNQIKNGTYVRMALLAMVLGKI